MMYCVVRVVLPLLYPQCQIKVIWDVWGTQVLLDLTWMYGGLVTVVNEGCFVFLSPVGLLVDLRHSQPWRMWKVIPKQTNQRYELVMFKAWIGLNTT